MKHSLLIFIFFSFYSLSQDRLTIDPEGTILGNFVTDKMSYYEETSAKLSPEEFLSKKSDFEGVKMTSKLENLDFVSSSIFIHFTLENLSGKNQSLVLETARPFTNRLCLFCVETKTTVYSGDAIPFREKCLSTNCSAMTLFVPEGTTREFVLRVNGDGENLSVPIVFYDRDKYSKLDSDRRMIVGIFIGVFIFVIIIFSVFFVMLREPLFLIYVLYASFSGLFQLALDGYMHEYIFTSGGYLTQHCVFAFGVGTTTMGMTYASNYLGLTGFWKKLEKILIAIILCSVFIALAIDVRFEIAFHLINGISIPGIAFMIVPGVISVRKKKASRLFLIGMSFLAIGALVFITGNLGVFDSPLITSNALKFGTLMEMIFLALVLSKRYKTLNDEREKAQQALYKELEEKNRAIAGANERLELKVEERTQEIETQRKLLKEKNDNFTASVTYAERIQSAILTDEQKLSNILPNSFVYSQPKDIVSGDFYWIDELINEDSNSKLIGYVTADCTGHGVSGAFVSIIGNYLLDSGNLSNGLTDPGKALDELSIGMNSALNSNFGSKQIRDGMDLTLCLLDEENRILHFAGAKNSVYIVRKGKLFEFKGDRKSIGFNPKEESHNFQSQSFQLERGDIIYSCTDGYADQFGGVKGKKFRYQRLRSLFVELSDLPLSEQKNVLRDTLLSWKGDIDQLDDILVMGVRIED